MSDTLSGALRRRSDQLLELAAWVDKHPGLGAGLHAGLSEDNLGSDAVNIPVFRQTRLDAVKAMVGGEWNEVADSERRIKFFEQQITPVFKLRVWDAQEHLKRFREADASPDAA